MDTEYPFIGVPDSLDMGDKVLLICLVIQVYNALRMQRPDVTIYQTIKACTGPAIGNDTIVNNIANMCKEFYYGCEKFPDVGIPNKEAPKKIKELISHLLPF